ncbi:MAG: hypothetical protein MZW92_68105 [Comamonadaceae bacterium]|nr:hypothetical protein [Comamonadaceae bacterium]
MRVGGDRASTDGNTIWLPALPLEDAEAAVLGFGLLFHETNHVRYTDFAVEKGTGLVGRADQRARRHPHRRAWPPGVSGGQARGGGSGGRPGCARRSQVLHPGRSPGAHPGELRDVAPRTRCARDRGGRGDGAAFRSAVSGDLPARAADEARCTHVRRAPLQLDRAGEGARRRDRADAGRAGAG